MVRTRDRFVRTVGGKSSAKKGGGEGGSRSNSNPKSNRTSRKSNPSIGGNPVCHRETPGWQKPITNFFTKIDHVETCGETSAAGSTDSKDIESGCSSAHLDSYDSSTEDKKENEDVDLSDITVPVGADNKLSNESPLKKNNESENNIIEGVACKTPTSEKKRKTGINILTPRKIQSNE